ncbi:alpha/beta hydrolase fold-3 domain protein [Aspergillus costaricaensis CBS 115574]|uniref:Alpha/beta hydrolase fold-3 domain protein n=1 Tax=Aspergillus costaricaensis CBS 115574 TaxID=1448317 RepID=A0ACD1IBL6_9EURO|nr:alpha/beta hydrolase fold-3 domain protein [Aspergillus costaricaensis CBS 115574]RAK87662.1 alpha/beta hydrolase fold-3 domain protein [Aspergillus costaricaensis CBS 115574]
MSREQIPSASTGQWLSQRDTFAIENLEWEEFYRNNRSKVPHLTGSVQQYRQTMREAKMRAQQHESPIVEGLKVYDLTTDSPSSLKLRIYKLLSPGANGAVMIYFHGGGWALGDLEGEDNICRVLCVQAMLNVVSVDYRLAPENPHPAPIQEAITALRWLFQNNLTHGFDTSNVYVGGTSAGANLAAVLCQLSRSLGVEIRGQLLRSPVLCSSELHYQRMGLKSMEQFVDTPILDQRSMKQFLEWYQPYDRGDPTVSPLLSRDLGGSPPSFIMICGRDPLRDEALAYADKLEERGTPVRVAVYPGMPHAFWIFPELTTTRTATQDMINGARWLISEVRST